MWPGRWVAEATRDRDAIYGDLTAVFRLVAVWTAEGRELDRARRALHFQRFELSDREDPFAAVIYCTADPAKADKRTRSKWSRALRHAAAHKPDSEPVEQFIRRKGGIKRAPLGSRGASEEVRQGGPRDGRGEGDQALTPDRVRDTWEDAPARRDGRDPSSDRSGSSQPHFHCPSVK
jgi:hypothetical protein